MVGRNTGESAVEWNGRRGQSYVIIPDIPIMKLMEDVKKGELLSTAIVVGEAQWLVNDFYL